jgi:uncharacterized membrane protein
MSQNRNEARDRLKAAAFEVNLKAETLLEHLATEIEELKVLLAQRVRGSGGEW